MSLHAPPGALPTSPLILGLDGGLANTGVVLARVVGRMQLELVDAAVIRTTPKDGLLHERLAFLHRALAPWVARGPSVACLESFSAPRSAGAAAKAAAAYGVAVGMLEAAAVPVRVRTPGAIKRALGLPRGASKADMMARVYELVAGSQALLEQTPKTRREHVADALGAIVGQADDPVVRMVMTSTHAAGASPG